MAPIPGGEGAPTYKFAGFSQKLHEIKKILVRRRGHPPLIRHCKIHMPYRENWYFYQTEDLNFGNTSQEINRLKTLPCKILPTSPFCYFQCFRLLLNIILSKYWFIGQKWFFTNLSPDCLFERINSLQCYELTRRCSHLLLYIDFTNEFCCAPLISTLWMCNEAQEATNF